MRKILFFNFIFFLIILNSFSVFSLGISPAKTKIDFNQNQEYIFKIITDEYPIKVLLTKEGELGKYIQIEKDSLIVESTETIVKFKLNLPENLPPGERTGSILILKLPNEKSNDPIIATIAVVHKIIVNVPYPGKYAEGNLFITNTKVNEPIIFTFAIKNFGKERIENGKINLIIKGPTNQELYKATSEKKSIEPNKEENFVLTWQTENSGSYVLEATFEYDGKVLEFNQRFDVGNLELEIEKIQVNNFKIGQIAKLDIFLRNKWNKQIKADGKVEVFKDNKLISSFNAIPITINEKSSEIMNAYWNTEGITIGNYDISAKVNYEGKISEKTYTAYVSADNINFKDFVSAKVVGQKSNNNINILIFAVIILIILNIALIIYVKKRNN
ncbi:MAG: CARDB domain-containing protein [Candidatus Woesearchaeota archaeon]